ncbi:unnamed protein product [Vitrella brassicaformis CCMP3155]|uniref:Uncharacterized protein n=1 Tax=Vitrella brassicaformis (strain CCMP3155) TaxID=1169540 RepID=A0A0G4FRH8_VITBC|nr:unnamed protein product [Vitrella brassicaformis CCMP3155]|eukprot:CEM16702.1 unnamed protein product [Vitrella brassicaformis CCMP3155]
MDRVGRVPYEGASASVTHTSNDASLWRSHTPRITRSVLTPSFNTTSLCPSRERSTENAFAVLNEMDVHPAGMTTRIMITTTTMLESLPNGSAIRICKGRVGRRRTQHPASKTTTARPAANDKRTAGKRKKHDEPSVPPPSPDIHELMAAHTSQAKEVRALLAKAAEKLEKDRKRCEKSIKIGSPLLTDFLAGLRCDMSGLKCRHMPACLCERGSVRASERATCPSARGCASTTTTSRCTRPLQNDSQLRNARNGSVGRAERPYRKRHLPQKKVLIALKPFPPPIAERQHTDDHDHEAFLDCLQPYGFRIWCPTRTSPQRSTGPAVVCLFSTGVGDDEGGGVQSSLWEVVPTASMPGCWQRLLDGLCLTYQNINMHSMMRLIKNARMLCVKLNARRDLRELIGGLCA